LAPLLQAARTVPIVFGSVADPVGAGFVDSLARPGGNATGFMQFEYSLSGKWLELLKEIAPGVTHAAVLRDPTITAGSVPAPNPRASGHEAVTSWAGRSK
jgi:putative ABC transport system substrate-binding protein